MPVNHVSCSTVSLQVVAEDGDLVGSIKYGTSGVVPAPTYFSVNPSTGEVKVAKDLTEDRSTIYIVSSDHASLASVRSRQTLGSQPYSVTYLNSILSFIICYSDVH